MKRRRDERLPRGLERALHGGRATRAASDPLRPPEDWELAVAALELAFLSGACLEPEQDPERAREDRAPGRSREPGRTPRPSAAAFLLGLPAPPVHLGATITRLLDPDREPER